MPKIQNSAAEDQCNWTYSLRAFSFFSRLHVLNDPVGMHLLDHTGEAFNRNEAVDRKTMGEYVLICVMVHIPAAGNGTSRLRFNA